METENHLDKVIASASYFRVAIGSDLANSYVRLMEILLAIEGGSSLKALGVDKRSYRKLITDVDQMLVLLKMSGKEVASIYIPKSLKEIIPFSRTIDNQQF